MRVGLLIITMLLFVAIKAQSVTFKEANCIIDYNSKSEIDFTIKIQKNDIYKNSNVVYNKIRISHFGVFYIAKVDNIFFSSLGSTREDKISIWLGEDGKKEIMFELGKEKQYLGYPFRGYIAYYNQESSNDLQIYDVIKTECYSLNDKPFILKRILVLKGVINQLVLRKKSTERCFHTIKK